MQQHTNTRHYNVLLINACCRYRVLYTCLVNAVLTVSVLTIHTVRKSIWCTQYIRFELYLLLRYYCTNKKGSPLTQPFIQPYAWYLWITSHPASMLIRFTVNDAVTIINTRLTRYARLQIMKYLSVLNLFYTCTCIIHSNTLRTYHLTEHYGNLLKVCLNVTYAFPYMCGFVSYAFIYYLRERLYITRYMTYPFLKYIYIAYATITKQQYRERSG